MFDILKEVRAEAEHELAVAQAKIAVVNSIEEKMLAKNTEVSEISCEQTSCEETDNICSENDIF